MLSSGRWMGLGSAILGVGALLAVSWLIDAIQSKINFWSWPGIVGVAGATVGFVVLVAGFMMPVEDDKQTSPEQRQYGGPLSVNLQAGRDIQLGDPGSSE